MCSASWRDVFHTFKKCNRARIDGKVLEAHLEGVVKVLPPGCPKVLEAAASYRPLEHIPQDCQFRLKVAVEEVQEEVRMVLSVFHHLTTQQVRLTVNMEDRCQSSFKAIL
jgi:hypothetical protein